MYALRCCIDTYKQAPLNERYEKKTTHEGDGPHQYSCNCGARHVGGGQAGQDRQLHRRLRPRAHRDPAQQPDLAVKAAKGQVPAGYPKITYTPPVAITKANAAQYYKPDALF